MDPNSCPVSPFRAMNVSPTATFVGFVTAEKIADVVSAPKFEVEELETDLVVAGRDVLAEGIVALSLEDPTGRPSENRAPNAWAASSTTTTRSGNIVRSAPTSIAKPP